MQYSTMQYDGLLRGVSAKNLPATAEMRVQPLCQEDPLEKEMAAHSSILAWEIPRTEEPGGGKNQTRLSC